MESYIRYIAVAFVATIIGIFIYNIWDIENTAPSKSYSEFITEVNAGHIKKAHIKGGEIEGLDRFDQPFTTYSPDIENLMPKLIEKNVLITTEKISASGLKDFIKNLLPMLFILGGWYIFLKTKGEKGKFKKSKEIIQKNIRQITFDDVAGIPEAKEELLEIVDFLKNPTKYTGLGGRIPKGVLLQGAPGTGKTLLAKAIAGEAGTPFYSISGSDFVEMYVGVGASRVRELFTEAKKNAPCIIFIDEIDAVGRQRGAGDAAGGQDEREQTLNALLVEMDGFQSDVTVIIVAATNRPDILDPALLRAGRFDRLITVPLPDVKGRLEILKVHSKNVVLSKTIELDDIARITSGFSGAELANLVNEAALMAARKGKSHIEMSDFDVAKDKITMGIERKSVVITEKERKTTAYHEAGHTIVARLLPETDPVHKISIIPRGMALGITQQLPIDDRHTYSKQYLINRIKILLGGKVAEEIGLNQETTGAVNDLNSATDITIKMVCEWGMSEKLGPVAYFTENQSFLGASALKTKSLSEATAKKIDDEVKSLILKCYYETKQLLTKHIKLLHRMAEILLVQETMEAEDIDIVFNCYYSKLETENKEIDVEIKQSKEELK